MVAFNTVEEPVRKLKTLDCRILILGGTADSYALANKLFALSFNIISSLAGRTQNPRLPKGQIRVGGFGGVAGLKQYLTDEKIAFVIDATHPFAKQITEHALQATSELNVPFLRLERKEWQAQKGDLWTCVNSETEAATKIPPESKCLLALGRQHILPFAYRDDVQFVARMLEPTDIATNFANFEQIIAKPGNWREEMEFLQTYNINIIVCRNSGGSQSYAKLIAARKLSLPTILIQRVKLPNIPIVETAEEAKIYLQNYFSSLEKIKPNLY